MKWSNKHTYRFTGWPSCRCPLNKCKMSTTAKVTPIFIQTQVLLFLTLYFVADDLLVVLLNYRVYCMTSLWVMDGDAIANLDDVMFALMMAETIWFHHYEWREYISEELLCCRSVDWNSVHCCLPVCYNFICNFKCSYWKCFWATYSPQNL